MFRDLDGKILFQFVEEVLVDLVAQAELLVLRKCFLIVAASRWFSTHIFLFESDSKCVVVWVSDPLSITWQFYNVIRECCHVFGVRY